MTASRDAQRTSPPVRNNSVRPPPPPTTERSHLPTALTDAEVDLCFAQAPVPIATHYRRLNADSDHYLDQLCRLAETTTKYLLAIAVANTSSVLTG